MSNINTIIGRKIGIVNLIKDKIPKRDNIIEERKSNELSYLFYFDDLPHMRLTTAVYFHNKPLNSYHEIYGFVARL